MALANKNALRNTDDEGTRFNYWTKLPLVVKILILKLMTLSDQIALSSLSKQCQELIRPIPIHMRVMCVRHVGSDEPRLFSIDEEKNPCLCEVEDIWSRLTLSKSTIYRFILGIRAAEYENVIFKNFLSKIKKFSHQENSIKTKFLVWNLNENNMEFVEQLMPYFDPSSLEELRFHGTFNQRVYEYISSTIQWEVCKNLFVSMENVAIEEAPIIDISKFIHFDQLVIEVNKTNRNSIRRLIENFASGRHPIGSNFFIGCFNGIPISDVLPQREGLPEYSKFFVFPHNVIGHDDWVLAVSVGRRHVQAMICERDGWEDRYGGDCWIPRFCQSRVAMYMENIHLPSVSDGPVAYYNFD